MRYFLILSIVCIHLFASDLSEISLNKNVENLHQKNPTEKYANYTFAYPNIVNGNAFITLEYLYWKVFAHIPYALKYNLATVSTNQFSQENVAIQSVNFQYKPGFRVSCGLYLPQNGWVVSFEYTRHYSKDDDSVQGNDYILDPNNRLVGIWNSVRINGDNPIIFADFHAKQRVHYNVLNGILSKTLLWPSKFSLSPYFGVQAAWVKVSASILYKGFASTFFPFIKTNLLNRFRGLGTKGGMKASWTLPFGFGIFGNLSLAQLWGRFHLNQQEFQIYDSSDNGSMIIQTKARDRFNKIAAIQTAFQFMLGTNWGLRFKKDRFFFGIQAVYEVNFWPDLIQLRKYLITKNGVSSTDENHINYYRDNVAFQGLTLKTRFDF